MPGDMNRSSMLSVVLLVSAIFTGSMLSAHAARPSGEQSTSMSSSQGDREETADPGYWQVWAAATAQ